mmetsp:Transcript_66640/g.192509  ORF Transcript_66640/g.192509 Transcript_66640/m.192509 type:complete len:384 (-) Transcript_66640:1956-3107(-)
MLSQTCGVSSETQMKLPARLSSDTITSFFMASSSHGTALNKVRPSCSLAMRWTAFLAFECNNCHKRSSRPPLRAINWTMASPAAARALECSLAAARSKMGSTRARLNKPLCCNPKADNHRAKSFKFAASCLGPSALSLRSLGCLPIASAFSRSSMRMSNGKAISSKGTRPWSTVLHNASAATCCGDVAVLEPPPASVWSSSTMITSATLSDFEAACSCDVPRSKAANSSDPTASVRESESNSSKIVKDARNTFAILSFAAVQMTSATARTISVGEPVTSEKFFAKYVSASQRNLHMSLRKASWTIGPMVLSSSEPSSSRFCHSGLYSASGATSSSGPNSSAMELECNGGKAPKPPGPRNATFLRAADGVGAAPAGAVGPESST